MALQAAARELMKLVDAAGTRAGKYDVDVRGAQGVQVGDGNQQFNVYSGVQPLMMDSRRPLIRPGQPRNEAAFGPVYEAAGGAAVLGEALGEVQEDGPGLVQYFGGGRRGAPAVICGLYNRSRQRWQRRYGTGYVPSERQLPGEAPSVRDSPLLVREPSWAVTSAASG